MYYNLSQNWQKPFTVEMYRSSNVAAVKMLLKLDGNLSLYVAKLFSPFRCPNTYPVTVSRIRNESVT